MLLACTVFDVPWSSGPLRSRCKAAKSALRIGNLRLAGNLLTGKGAVTRHTKRSCVLHGGAVPRNPLAVRLTASPRTVDTDSTAQPFLIISSIAKDGGAPPFRTQHRPGQVKQLNHGRSHLGALSFCRT